MEQSAAMTHRAHPEPRSAYRHFRPIQTRWADNDAYGHVNNVVYYAWFDTAVNGYLIEAGALDIHAGATIGLVIETRCNYFASLAFPQQLEAGLRVAHMGRSSVRYEVGLFAHDAPEAAAAGSDVSLGPSIGTPGSDVSLAAPKKPGSDVALGPGDIEEDALSLVDSQFDFDDDSEGGDFSDSAIDLDADRKEPVRGGSSDVTRRAADSELFVAGTPLFMAPEQFSEDGHIGAWTDLYAFGVMLHVLLAGSAPFQAESVPELLLQKYRSPESDALERAGAPPELVATIRALLAPDEDVIGAEHLPEDLAAELVALGEPPVPEDAAATDLRLASARIVREAIAASGGNMSLAARGLGISRNTLYRKVRDIEIG